MTSIECITPDDTEALGSRLAPLLRPGDVVVLSGGLGAGKTLFTRGVATGLGVDEPVTSPSFVLVREYRTGFMPVVHVDVYRLGTINEFDDLDVFESAREGVMIIEWGSAVEPALGADHLTVEFQVGDDGARTLSFVPTGDWTDRDLGGFS